MRRAVLVDDFDLLHPEQTRPGLSRIRRRRTRQQEDRISPVHPAEPAKPTDDLGHVGPEDPAVPMCLVDDDIPQTSQQGGPPGVGGQHCVVQHVWIGEDVPGLLPGESALGVVGVTVEGGNQPVARPDFAADPVLVVGQGLRRGQIQGAVAFQGIAQGGRQIRGGRVRQHRSRRRRRRHDRQQVGQGLARCRCGADGGVVSGFRQLCEQRLMLPRV